MVIKMGQNIRVVGEECALGLRNENQHKYEASNLPHALTYSIPIKGFPLSENIVPLNHVNNKITILGQSSKPLRTWEIVEDYEMVL